jgi:hypothetical protein
MLGPNLELLECGKRATVRLAADSCRFTRFFLNRVQTPIAMRIFCKALLVLWACPYSLLGIFVGCLGMLFGGKGRYRDGALEFYGGLTGWCVRHLPTGQRTAGITLGHVILGQTGEGLEQVGVHERVHVRQFERWGPVMGPAYLLASAWMWCVGRDPYRDNPFEVEAYRIAP